MTSTEVVGPLPTVVFYGGPRHRGRRYDDLPRVAYTVPRDTRDLRFSTCADHHVACDCREAELAENLAEHQGEWKRLRAAARSALAGHQLQQPFGLRDVQLCLCSGCSIERATNALLGAVDIDYRTGRVKQDPPPF